MLYQCTGIPKLYEKELQVPIGEEYGSSTTSRTYCTLTDYHKFGEGLRHEKYYHWSVTKDT